MVPELQNKVLNNSPRALGDAELSSQTTRQRSMLATFGIGIGVAASVVFGLGGSANARQNDNPPPALLAKIQIATQAIHRTPTVVRARTMTRGTVRRVVRSR